MTTQMQNYLLWVVGVLIVGGFIWWGQERRNDQHNEQDKLRVGLVIPLSGQVSLTGEDFLNGLQLAKDEFGIDGVELFIEDSKSNPKDGVNAAKRILDTRDIDVLVSLQSAVVVPILGLAEEYKKPLIATAVSHDKFAEQSEFSFRVFPPPRQDAVLAAQFANEKGYRTVAVVTVNDEYGVSMKEYFKNNFKGHILYDESFGANENDFRSILLKASNTDAVFFVGYMPNYINFFKQTVELNRDVPVISNLVMVSNAVRAEVGGLLRNSFAAVPASTVLVQDQRNEFRREYMNRYNKEPDWAAPFGHDIMLILNEIQKSAKAPLQALNEVKVQGLNGVISFDEVGEFNIPVTMVGIKDGRIFEYDPTK